MKKSGAFLVILSCLIFSVGVVGQTPNPTRYELSCPPPYQPLTFAVSVDTQTMQHRAYGCINEMNGQILWQPDNFNVQGTIGGPGLNAFITPLRVNNPPLNVTNEIADVLGNLTINSYGAAGYNPVMTVTPSPTGSTSYTYAAYEYAVSSTDFQAARSYGHSTFVDKTISNGAATLGGGNTITLSLPCMSKFDSVRFYRVSGGGSSGFIPSTATESCSTGTATLIDTGITGDASGFFSGDTSGLLRVQGVISETSPFLGMFTPQAGAQANAVGFGSYSFASSNPFTPLFSCSATLCEAHVALRVDSGLALLGGATISGASATINVGTVEQAGQAVAVSGANGVSAGSIVISASTTGSHTFSTAYTLAPNCVVSEQGTTPASLDDAEVTTSSTAVTITLLTSATATFFFVCYPTVN